MTIRGNHLLCDCAKAIKSATCPRPILSPMMKRDSSYFHCPTCGFDYTCSQAIKNVTEADKFGYPVSDKLICRKCESKLVKRTWPE